MFPSHVQCAPYNQSALVHVVGCSLLGAPVPDRCESQQPAHRLGEARRCSFDVVVGTFPRGLVEPQIIGYGPPRRDKRLNTDFE